MRCRGLVVVAIACATSLAWADGSRRPVPQVGPGQVQLPPAPAFELVIPSPTAKGVAQVRLEQSVSPSPPIVVRGYVTWMFDCVAANVAPGKTRAQIARAIAANPALCDRPTLVLGDSKATPREYGLTIADVPARLALAVGDLVELTATPDAGGVLVFGSGGKARPAAVRKVAVPAAVAVPPLVVPKPAPTRGPPRRAKAEIDAAMAAGRRAYDGLSWSEAIAAYQRALARWEGNDVAWYELGRSAEAPGKWAEALAAYAKAFALVPTNAVYAYRYGLALYVAELMKARLAEAKRLGIHEEYVVLPPGTPFDLQAAQQVLEYAVTLAPDQWEAQTALGHLHLARRQPAAAADAFRRAVARGPDRDDPYLSLARVYREWGHPDAAVAVALEGIARERADASSQLRVLAATLYEDLRDDARALALLDGVLAKPFNRSGLEALQRARILIRAKQWDKARADIETFAKYNANHPREVNALLVQLPAPPP